MVVCNGILQDSFVDVLICFVYLCLMRVLAFVFFRAAIPSISSQVAAFKAEAGSMRKEVVSQNEQPPKTDTFGTKNTVSLERSFNGSQH